MRRLTLVALCDGDVRESLSAPVRVVESTMTKSFKLASVVLASACMLTLGSCNSSSDSVIPSCTDGCDREGDLLCMNDTKYRQCTKNNDGCLDWDCST